MSQERSITASIFPSLAYDDAGAAVEYLCRVFGFEKKLVVPGPGGSVRHSELRLGNGVVFVGSSKPERQWVSPRRTTAKNGALSVRVDDPDEHFARAKAAGAKITQELKDEDYGSRGYMAQDLEGHDWYFGTYLPGAHWSADGKHA